MLYTVAKVPNVEIFKNIQPTNNRAEVPDYVNCTVSNFDIRQACIPNWEHIKYAHTSKELVCQ